MILSYKQTILKAQLKLLELKNEFSKAVDYKINIKKSVAFLYIKNEISEKEVEKISFTKASKIKYLDINLTKILKDSYNEN